MAEMLLPDKLTPCAPADLYDALQRAWGRLILDAPCTRQALLVLLAHWALETGGGHACHWYNLGNKKRVAGDGHDYTQFACGEELPLAYAQRAAASDPDHIKIVGQYQASGQDMASVRFLPPHSATSFVAFPDLDAGTVDYLVGLRGRFRAAWPYVVAGDAAGFCHALRLQRYYTADEGQYTAGVMRWVHQLDGMIPQDMTPEEIAKGHLAAVALDTPADRETQPELPES